MRKQSLLLTAVVLFLALLCAHSYKVKTAGVPRQNPPKQRQNAPQKVEPEEPESEEPEEPEHHAHNISVKIPTYLDYSGVIQQCKTWNQEAAEITEIGTYGKSSQGQSIYYFRINAGKKDSPKVLITSCIHGNEPWATGCVMGYIGTLLDQYGKNKEITKLLDQRDIYFVPVVSPDSYPHSRHIDGVDPNRDFPGPSRPNHRSTPSVAALQKFFLDIRPKAVISGHTYGRVYLTPFGDTAQPHPQEQDYQRIVGEMAQLSNYRTQHCHEIYGRPIYGSEIDWFCRNGAFAIVSEFGTHQRKPSHEEIKSEFERTFKAALLFIKEAPIVTRHN